MSDNMLLLYFLESVANKAGHMPIELDDVLNGFVKKYGVETTNTDRRTVCAFFDGHPGFVSAGMPSGYMWERGINRPNRRNFIGHRQQRPVAPAPRPWWRRIAG
jgi:hypothetical protein